MNFDTITDRHGTDCLKYDSALRRHRPATVQPFWVADMDFPTAPAILKALHARIDHGIFGYSEADPDRFYAILYNWFQERHHWRIQKDWLIQTPGIVFALAMAVRAYTSPGDSILIQQPVYYPFSEVIQDNKRNLINAPLVLKDGHYTIDFKIFEKKIMDHKVKLLLLCSPHNPGGRVWTKEELIQLGDICLSHHVLIVADEIHEDFVWPGYVHTVFASLGEKYEQNSIICTSPSKTFNIAGLQLSNIFIPNKNLRRKFKKEIAKAGYSQLNTLGLIAGEIAYREGAPWLDELKLYLYENINYTQIFLQKHLPQIKFIRPEGTYLVWLDFRPLGLTEAQREDVLLNQAGLWLDSGAMFGPDGTGFERLNIACPRIILKTALEKLSTVI
ncbi:aminotransferase [Megasphaera cerevisiae DSM 20462]|jgi:cystathionine beta-lyase|uniref:cysteine-S-conjugate beta-lyase n=1 Tax=Megasphaera cerevisiae DSM 20462 TaxID=1122219 RepID=A0A0J6WTK7_9FIRM|nr:MalY/PatB family protein [Megasphaera cerevisiae]KMO86880.1 aminotransferase [Megasphaera cerevisiae DSM 20462]SJZ80969.1 cystathione beta-lyase [Megasphaera cerevisiae DSM 20462]